MKPNRILPLLALTLCLLLAGCGSAAPAQTAAPAAAATPAPTETPITEQVKRTVTAANISELEELNGLKEADLSGSTCYPEILAFAKKHPEVKVTYTVDLAGTAVNCDETALELPEGYDDFDSLLENLAWLPKLESVSLPQTALSAEELEELRETYPDTALDYTVRFSFTELASDCEKANLCALTPGEVADAAEALKKLPDLKEAELMNADGESPLSLADVKTLQDAAPDVRFHYTFDFYGQTLSTLDERVEYDGTKVESAEEVREVLDVMQCCTYFKLADCGLDSETMASIRDDYPDTKVVWRVYFGGYMHCLTDEETIRAIFTLDDTNCSELKYCTEVKWMDIGHDTELHDTSFIAYMPHLEICILSGSPCTDLTPFENCPDLIFLELVWCGYVKDISPLVNCPKLAYLNLCYSLVEDLSPLDDLPLERFMYYDSKCTADERARFIELHPDCWTNFDGANPYVLGWRYDDQGYTWCDMYKRVREVFRYDENFYNKG